MTKKRILTALAVISGRLKTNELNNIQLSDLGFSGYNIENKNEITEDWIKENAESVILRAIVGVDE